MRWQTCPRYCTPCSWLHIVSNYRLEVHEPTYNRETKNSQIISSPQVETPHILTKLWITVCFKWWHAVWQSRKWPMMTHDDSWRLMRTHDDSLWPMMTHYDPWWLMTTQDDSWRSWRLMTTHDNSWVNSRYIFDYQWITISPCVSEVGVHSRQLD